MKKIFLILLFYFLIYPSKSFAYFDPGTGAFIIQAILGFLAAIVASLTMTWSRVKLFFTKIFQIKPKPEKKDDK
jgi:hypothetical protein|tara:strand:- start:299 stop:520 length:222 start_codon:yes stop_codon:yes gene_type:complete